MDSINNPPRVILIDLDHTFWNFNSWVDDEKDHDQLNSGLYPEALDCVHLLKTKGYMVGFASASTKKELCERYIDMLFPPGYLDFVHVEPTYPSKKKHFDHVSEKFNVKFEEMLLIDDLERILQDAAHHGVPTIDAMGGLSIEKINHLL